MESGDGLLVRIPLKFGRIQADILGKMAGLSKKYGNGHFDLSNRGNLQLRGIKPETYDPLKAELARLGFERYYKIAIIANPLDKNAEGFAEKLYSALSAQYVALPDKYLIVIDGGGIFPLSGLACDLYINPADANIQQISGYLQNVKNCNKKQTDINAPPAPVGFVPLAEMTGVIIASPVFGRIEAEELIKLAEIAKKFSGGEIIFAPLRRIILPDITSEKSTAVVQDLAEAGFITEGNDSRLNIHACVGAPACSSALGETRPLAKKWAEDNPNLTQIVHITGCSKGCAYRGKADITIDLSINPF